MNLKSHCKVIGIVAILLMLSNILLNAHNHSNKALFSENAIDPPEISSSSTTNELCGNSSTVILSIQNPVADAQYRWFKDDVESDGTNEFLAITEIGAYKLLVIVAFDTSDFSNVIDITMNPDKEFPEPILSIDSENGQLCGEGSSALLHVQNNSSYHDATYSWLLDGVSIGVSTLPSYWVTGTGTYATIVEQNGCFHMSPFVEVVSEEKTIAIPEINFTNCTSCGESAQLSVSNTINYTAPTYQWYRENEIIPDAVTSKYFTQTAGNFKVLVIDEECAVFSEEVDVKVIRNALATDIEVSNDTICINESVSLEILNPITGATYTWYSSNNPTPITIIATEEGVLTTGKLSSDTTFYVSVRHDTLCENTAGNLKAVHISVNTEKQFSLITIDTLITLPYGVCDTFIAIIPHLKFSSDIGASNIQILNDAPADLIFAKGKHKITWIAKDECGFIDTAIQWVIVNMPICGELDTIWHLNSINCEEPFYELQSLKAVDYENNEYPTVWVDCKCWTAENLRSTVYSDGSSVENPQAYYAQMYPDTEANTNRYGLLYNWKDATNNVATHDGKMQGVCPDGWYLPSAAQFAALIPYGSSALQKPDLWIKSDHITNSAGLSIVPAGFYNSPIDRFDFLRGDAFFWSSTSIEETTSYGVHFQCLCPELRINQYPINHGFSVRCVKE